MRSSTDPADTADTAEEIDLWWGSYAGRTMVPVFLLCGLLTLVVAVSVRILASRHTLPPNFSRIVTDGFGVLFWLTLVICWAYRIVAINYRLTTHRLYCQRGLYTPASPGIDLGRIAQIVVVRGSSERIMGVGRLRISKSDNSPPVVMEGVKDPDRVAVMIRKEIERVRGRG